MRIIMGRRGGKVSATILLLRADPDAVCFVTNEEMKKRYPEDVKTQVLTPEDLLERGLYVPQGSANVEEIG